MSNPPPGPATTPTRSVCVSISACPPRTAELLLRNGLLPEVHRDGCGGPCRRASPSGEHDLAGEGRVAGEQRTTPSSPCAIQLIASCTWRVLERLFMRWATFTWSHSVWSPSAVHVSSAVCGKSSSSAEPWRGNWPQSFDGRSRSLSERGNSSALGPSQSATGVNRTTPHPKNPGRNISIF